MGALALLDEHRCTAEGNGDGTSEGHLAASLWTQVDFRGRRGVVVVPGLEGPTFVGGVGTGKLGFRERVRQEDDAHRRVKAVLMWLAESA